MFIKLDKLHNISLLLFQLPNLTSFFQSRHSDSLALMYILQDDCDRASYYAALCEQSFLSVSYFAFGYACFTCRMYLSITASAIRDQLASM